MTALLGEWERITGSERIGEMIVALVREQGPAWLRLTSDQCVPVRTVRANGRGLLLEGATPDALSALMLEWTGYNSLFRTRAEPHADETGALRMLAPGTVDRLQRRSFRRVRPSMEVAVRCRRAVDAGATVDTIADGERVFPLRDVSCDGLSLWLADAAAAPAALGEVCTLTLVDGDGRPIVLDGEVRSFGGSGGGGVPFVGFRIRPASSRDGAAWFRYLERHLHPRVRTGSDGLAQLWSLYESAGYFHLSGKSPSDFAELRASFIAATRRALDTPSVGLQAVWPEAGPPVAALSALRFYESSWLGFHMAKRSGRAPDGTAGRLVLREIHLSIYERIQRDPGARWIVGHTQVRPVWSRLCHHDLTARYVGSGDAAIWRFRAIEVKAAPPVGEPPADVDVGVATREETARVLDAVAAQRPAAMLEALDLVPRRFDLREVRRRWWVAGLERDRALLVARRGSVVVAAIVLELADPGLHLFGLLDHALPFAFAPDGTSYFPSLLAAADAWYRARGRAGWVCFFDGNLEPQLSPGMSDMGAADMCILSTSRLSEFFEHVHEITAPRRDDEAVPSAASAVPGR